MQRIACRLVSHSPGAHIQQVYTGLSMLHRGGQITLTQTVVDALSHRPEAPQHLRDAAATHTKVVVNDAVRVHYDMHDAREIDTRDLDDCDCYFKRSYSADYVAGLARGAEKIRPFGLNYHVLPDFVDPHALRRALGLRGAPNGRLFAIREALDAGNRLTFLPRVRAMEAPPDPVPSGRVLFLVAAYDPHDTADRIPAKVEERRHNNEMRARCIRILRKELGPAFLGGFGHNAYTEQHYRDCLVEDARITDKKSYISLLKAHTICIATTGLHGSIGWKFAEYVACSRAIVSEPLAYQVPGGLMPGRNYLEFRSPDECVDRALDLIGDRRRTSDMMKANAFYYGTYLRPDVLMLNSLCAALALRPLSEGAGPGASVVQSFGENAERPRPIP